MFEIVGSNHFTGSGMVPASEAMEDDAVEEPPLSFSSPPSNDTPSSSSSSASTGSKVTAKPQHPRGSTAGTAGSIRGVRGGSSTHAATIIGDGIIQMSSDLKAFKDSFASMTKVML
jgi:hypothetical protein